MPYKKALKILLLGLVLMLTSCKSGRLLKKAYKSYEVGEYYTSADLFKRSLKKIKRRDEKAQVTFLMAECYRLTNQNLKADAKYKQVIRSKYADSISYLYAGLVELKINKLRDARKNFEIYLEAHPNDPIALNGIIACDSIPAWNKVKTRYVVKKYDDFNSRNSEFSPAYVGEDFDVIYFTSTREGLAPGKPNGITGQKSTDVFMSRLDSKNNWVDPEPLPDESINTEFDDGVTSFIPSGKKMYFTRASYEEGRSLGTSILVSERSGAKWSEPKQIKLYTDSLLDSLVFAHPAINNDETTLYFVSDLEGGYGGMDIWKVKNIAGKWSSPENLGPQINTQGNETFPYIREDGILYFSSDGFPGLGGLDIYKAEPSIVEDGDDESINWKVTNVLSPINSSYDDFGITFAGSKEYGFFSSNRRDSKGYDHIYSFIKPELEYFLEGAVRDEKTDDPLSDAVIKLIGNDGTNVKIKTKKDGSFSQKLNKNAEYVFLATSRGYLNQKGELSTMGLIDSKTFTNNFSLPSVKKPIRLNNITYEFGSYELTDTAKASLKNLIEILRDNPNITMEISAHTDMIGEEGANMILSEKRAQSVVTFLIENKIAKDRLVAKGYGESVPVVADEDMAKRFSFMKETDVLNASFVSRLNASNQEMANQINRRTEFKVLSTNYQPPKYKRSTAR